MEQAGRKRSAVLATITVLMFAVFAAGCTRASVPLTSTAAPSTLQPEPAEIEATLTPSFETIGNNFAIVWIPVDEKLQVRRPAGISGSVVAELSFDQTGIQLTSKQSRLGSSTWVEIVSPAGLTGWVQEWNLTEEVPADVFCSDMRVVRLLESIGNAIRNADGKALASVVHPKRGLTMRYEWWNPDINIPATSLINLFTDSTVYNWGEMKGSGASIEGSFNEIMKPRLDDVFDGTPQVSCNVLTAGTTSRVTIWPEEFTNVNFYTFHRSAPEGGNKYDWRTWALGFEYVGGTPYLSLLIQYRGDI
jgi:hypothetical protein